MRLGYACLLKFNKDDYGKQEYNFLTEHYKINRRLTVKKAKSMDKQELYHTTKMLTRQNFDGLYNIMLYNIRNNINMYRLSSDMIVLDNHELNEYIWHKDFVIIHICNKIKKLAQDNDIRLSIHPNHFNPIATDKEEVFKKVCINLESEYKVATMLGADVLCMHVGSMQGGKQAAINRFMCNFYRLPEYIQSMICLENDDKNYTVEDVLYICKHINRPMILDIHHDRCLPSASSIEYYMDDIAMTWNGKQPKCHLSSGKNYDTDRSHGDHITAKDLEHALKITKNKFDIMLECKNKNQELCHIKKVVKEMNL